MKNKVLAIVLVFLYILTIGYSFFSLFQNSFSTISLIFHIPILFLLGFWYKRIRVNFIESFTLVRKAVLRGGEGVRTFENISLRELEEVTDATKEPFSLDLHIFVLGKEIHLKYNIDQEEEEDE